LKEEQDIGEEKSSQFQMPNSQSSRKGREKIKPLKDPNAPPNLKKSGGGTFSKLNKAQQQPRKTKACSVDDLNI
jgi:hypothetical protein